MTQPNQVTIPVPLALQKLIKSNNNLLKTYQSQLLKEIEDANNEMMNLLNLNPTDGWRLDMDSMKYIRANTAEDDTPITE
jgi:hypothetical protein